MESNKKTMYERNKIKNKIRDEPRRSKKTRKNK